MMTLFLIIAGLIGFAVLFNPLATKLAQKLDENRVAREMKIERLQEQLNRKHYEDYMNRKK